MKKIRVLLLVFFCGMGMAMSQNKVEHQKVDNAYRLLRGAVLTTDFRMNAPILHRVQYVSTLSKNVFKGDGSTSIDSHNRKDLVRTVGLIQQGFLNQNLFFQPAIVLDNLLVNDNSQQFNIIQLTPLSTTF